MFNVDDASYHNIFLVSTEVSAASEHLALDSFVCVCESLLACGLIVRASGPLSNCGLWLVFG